VSFNTILLESNYVQALRNNLFLVKWVVTKLLPIEMPLKIPVPYNFTMIVSPAL